jgi:hypothetical protein
MSAAETPLKPPCCIEQEIVKWLWRSKLFVVLMIAASAVLLLLCYGWLSIPDAKAWQFGATIVLGLMIVCGAITWHGYAVGLPAYSRTHADPASKIGNAISLGGRWWKFLQPWKMMAIAIVLKIAWAAFAAAILFLLGTIAEMVPDLSAVIASWLTNTLRKPVSPAGVEVVLANLPWVAAWVLFAILWMPLFAAAASEPAPTFKLKHVTRAWRRWRYWWVTALTFFFGLWLPWLLAQWAPEVSGLWLETASMIVRVGIAFVVAVVAWLFLLAYAERTTSEGM